MENFRFNLEEDFDGQIYSLECIGSLKKLDDDQLTAMLMLSLPMEARNLLVPKLVSYTPIKNESDKELVQSPPVSNKKFAYAKKLVRELHCRYKRQTTGISQFLTLQPGPKETIATFACRLETKLNTEESGIPEQGKSKMIGEKIISLLPTRDAEIFRLSWDMSLDKLIKRLQVFCDEKTLSDNLSMVTFDKRRKNTTGITQTVFPGFCFKCGVRGHKASECRGTVKCVGCGAVVHSVRICKNSTSHLTNNFVREPKMTKSAVATVITPDNEEVIAIIDSGSEKSLINKKIVRSGIIFDFRDFNLFDANGRPIKIVGRVPLNVRIGPNLVTWNFYVVDGLVVESLVGRDFLRFFNITLKWNEKCCEVYTQVLNTNEELAFPSEPRSIAELLIKYESIFSKTEFDIGYSPTFRLKIDTCHSEPISQACYRLPKSMECFAKEQIKQMLDSGIITKSKSPWRAPVTLPLKKDGSGRFCVDYRKLNEVTKADSYPLPHIDAILDRMSSSNIFSTIDLKSAYWQIPIEPKDQEKTAFSLGPGFGLYEFKVMPFGLKNAPATYQRVMDIILSDFEFATCYLDDVIIFSKTMSEHITHLNIVLDKIVENRFKLKKEKCHFGLNEILFLGHKISGQGILPDPTKTISISQWPKPSTAKDLRTFLGACGFYRKFIRNFASLTKDLFLLMEIGSPLKWDQNCIRAFDELKLSFANIPLLSFPDTENELILQTDASKLGLGATLLRRINYAETPISFASRSLKKSEKKLLRRQPREAGNRVGHCEISPLPDREKIYRGIRP